MSIFGYEPEEEKRPILQKTGMLTTGIALCIASIVVYLISIGLYFTDFWSSSTYLPLSILAGTIPGILYVGILITFLRYLGNFNTQSVKTAIMVIIVLQIIYIFLIAGNTIANRIIMADESYSMYSWYTVISAIFTIFNLINWIACFIASATMLNAKSDYVGSIRMLGWVLLSVTIVDIFIYIFRTFGIPMILNNMGAISHDYIGRLYAFISVFNALFMIILTIAFLYVFVKASRYNTINN